MSSEIKPEEVKIKREYKANLKKLVGTDDRQLLEALSCLLRMTFKSDQASISKGKLSNFIKRVLCRPNHPWSLSSEGRRFCEKLEEQGIPSGVMNLILSASILPVIFISANEKDEVYQEHVRKIQIRRKETIKELKRCYDALLVLKPYLSNQDWTDLLEKIALSNSNDDYFSNLIRFMVTPQRYDKNELGSKTILSFEELVMKFEEKLPQYKRPKKGRPKGSYSEDLFLKCLSVVFKHYRIPDYVRKAGQFIAFLKGRQEVYSNIALELAASSKYSKRIRRHVSLN